MAGLARIAFTLGTALSVSPLTAQTATGRITEEGTAVPIEGADVTLLDAERKVVGRAATGDGGRYSMTAPRAGDYIVVADYLGYLRLESPLASFSDGRSVTVDFELPIDPIELDGLRVEAERQVELERRLTSYGVRVEALGRRFVPRVEIERRQAAVDFGAVVEWQSLPSVRVIRSDDGAASTKPTVCVRYRGGGCAMTVLNGQPVSLFTAAIVPPLSLDAIVVLTPMEASLSYGTQGGNGAVLLFTRTGGR